MSGAARIVAEAEAHGNAFTLGDGFVLHFDAQAGAMTSELRALLVAHKADVVQFKLEREERAVLQDTPLRGDVVGGLQG